MNDAVINVITRRVSRGLSGEYESALSPTTQDRQSRTLRMGGRQYGDCCRM